MDNNVIGDSRAAAGSNTFTGGGPIGNALRYIRDCVCAPYSALSPHSPQHLPLYYRPEWRVGHVVYQGGVPILKRSSMTGGGFIPERQWRGKEPPSIQPYATPVTSMTGGGKAPDRPNFLTALFGGNTGPVL